MGVGKSTVGVDRLAARPPAERSDEIIEGARTGGSYRPGHLVSDGEPAFRALETEVLVEALGGPRAA